MAVPQNASCIAVHSAGRNINSCGLDASDTDRPLDLFFPFLFFTSLFSIG